MADQKQPKGTDHFRDRLTTVSADGKRVWIYPKKPKGKLTTYRKWVALILLSIFFVAPFLQYKGEPVLLFDILERKFILFGVVFWPQDFHLIVLSIITFIVFIIVFTVIYGRVFCGWACPQTLFMEFGFRQIEYLIEGDSNKQRKLASQSLNFEKIRKKSLKFLLFLVLSFLIATTIMGYLFGIHRILEMSLLHPSQNLSYFVATLALTGIILFIFGFFREQVCTIVCPYGRLQGVLLDNKSLIVAYDYKRGEPRGPVTMIENGDCIDCNNCVTVCPTGVDIRNGTQLECINCTACIDACNSVMKKIKKPEGLIRFDSERGIEEGKRSIITTRSVAYTTVLLLLMTLVVVLFNMRGEVETTILRQKGSLFQEYGEDHFSNIYQLEIINKTRKTLPVTIKLTKPEGEIKMFGADPVLGSGKIAKGTFLVILPKNQLISSRTEVEFGIYSGDLLLQNYKATFVGPNTLDK
jgi:cytochrome c oxidase accessory protein FixG